VSALRKFDHEGSHAGPLPSVQSSAQTRGLLNVTHPDMATVVHTHFVEILKLVEGSPTLLVNLVKDPTVDEAAERAAFAMIRHNVGRRQLEIALSALACHKLVIVRGPHAEALATALRPFALKSSQVPPNRMTVGIEVNPGGSSPHVDVQCPLDVHLSSHRPVNVAPVVAGLANALLAQEWTAAPDFARMLLQSKLHDFKSIQTNFQALEKARQSQRSANSQTLFSLDFQRLREFIDVIERAK
jgi:hypothetical protein